MIHLILASLWVAINVAVLSGLVAVYVIAILFEFEDKDFKREALSNITGVTALLTCGLYLLKIL